jgi:hypothetical protein
MAERSWPSDQNRVSREELRLAIEQYSRDPFADALSALLQARPSLERMVQWAGEDPLKWANAVKIFAILGGYTEKTETLHLHDHRHIHKASDAQLLQMMQEMVRQDPGLLEELRTIDREALPLPMPSNDSE